MKREETATPLATPEKSPKEAAADKQILVLDGDSVVREMLSRVLTGEGYRVLSASTGPEALGLANAHPIDLALLDLNLPGQRGWETFERLTEDNPLLPVIIITARSNQLFTALGAGVGALLEKPLDFPTLLQTVSRLLLESQETRMARAAGRASEFYYKSSSSKDTA